MRSEKLFWGLLLVLGGVFLIVNKLGYFPAVNGFSLLLSLFLAAIMLKSIVRLNFAGILFPLAFICILYDEQLGITELTPWTLLLAATLGSIGLSMIFHRNISNYRTKHGYKKKINMSWSDEDAKKVDIEDDSYINFETNFGSSIKYINSNNFTRGDFECSFGAMKLYFDNTEMKEDRAVLNIEVSFGGMEIYVPKNWHVEDRTTVSFGDVKFKNRSEAVITNTLVLTGDVSFAGVEIIYV